jgi:hypothetical protein
MPDKANLAQQLWVWQHCTLTSACLLRGTGTTMGLLLLCRLLCCRYGVSSGDMLSVQREVETQWLNVKTSNAGAGAL